MAQKYKYSLLERTLISSEACRTLYETNIRKSENVNLDILKSSTKDGIIMNLGIREEDKDSILIEYLAMRKSELGMLVPERTYTLAVIDQGAISRLPEEFTIVTE